MKRTKMDSTEAIYNGLKDAEIDFVVSVPCVNLSKLLEMVDEDEEIMHIPVTREEEGIGICAGAYMGGRKPAILMQNSGLGNSINALKSLMELYKFPLVIIISHRGTEGETICGQIPMRESILRSQRCFNLPFHHLRTEIPGDLRSQRTHPSRSQRQNKRNGKL